MIKFLKKLFEISTNVSFRGEIFPTSLFFKQNTQDESVIIRNSYFEIQNLNDKKS